MDFYHFLIFVMLAQASGVPLPIAIRLYWYARKNKGPNLYPIRLVVVVTIEPPQQARVVVAAYRLSAGLSNPGAESSPRR